MENTVDWTQYEQAPEEEKLKMITVWVAQGVASAQAMLGQFVSIYKSALKPLLNAEKCSKRYGIGLMLI